MKTNYTYGMLLPGLIIYLAIFVAPSFGSFYYAFTNWNGFQASTFIGWDNFKDLLDVDNISLVLKNTFIFTIMTTTLKIALGLGLALLVNQQLRFATFLRSVFFFPAILSTVAVALAFSAIYHPSAGLLNEFLRMLHLDRLTQSWITDPHLVMYSISFVEIWQFTGLHMAIFLAGLQSIPKDSYESVTIEGASGWEKLLYITIPQMLPNIKANLFLSLIGGLKVFAIVFALTQGGPGGASQVIGTIVYKNFGHGQYGAATAANLVLFLLIIVIVGILNLVISRKEVEV
ncbi:carbohydrate ABC transporter permease [Cohnella soli]|uniref:Carbohydrate ABC transporter permease n=1 Tax=Cohnella soli TaxID=425005 RepID=A0ABW0HU03_9BACL